MLFRSLGLTFCRSVVQEMGGDIRIEHLPEGTLVVVRVPLAQAAAA